MDRGELARAIAKPAEIQGRAFESGLVERIIDDVGDKAGRLPLLEFALTKLWEEQEAGWLTHEAYEAGASLAHIHVRNPDESSSSDPALFARVQEGLRKHCPDMIQQFSTGGRGRDPNERGSSLSLKPDMASLATGSVNFKTIVYENTPQLIDALAESMLKKKIKPEIEIFDLAMLYNAADLVERGLLEAPAHVQFVLGIPNALPPRRKMLEFLLSELEDCLPGATWTAAGIARHQIEMEPVLLFFTSSDFHGVRLDPAGRAVVVPVPDGACDLT